MRSVQEGLSRFRSEAWLLGAGIVSGALYWKVAAMRAANGTPVLYFLASFLLLFLIYAGTALFVSHSEKGAHSPSIWWILLCALLFRLILIPAGLRPDLSWDRALLEDLRGTQVNYDTFLLYDQDIWRYLWEGRVWAAVENPYLLAPGDPELDHVVEWRAGEEDVWYEIRERVTFPELSTIYPPLTQFLFRMLDRVASPSVAAWKLGLILMEGLAVGLVALAARLLGRPMGLTLFLFCWNPLLVKSFAGSVHYDVLIVLTMALAAYCIVSDRPLLGYSAIGLATLSKFVPLVVVTVLKPMRWRGLLLLAAVVVLGYLPVVDTLIENFISTGQTFVRYWRFNSGPYLLAETMIGTWGAIVAYIGIIGGSILLVRLRVGEGIEGQLSSMLWILGLSIVLSPVVNPWYLTWLLPLAALTASTTWLAFSGIVFCAFFIMYDGVERSWILAIEYLALAGTMALEYLARRRMDMPQTRFTILLALTLLVSSVALSAQGSGSTAPVPVPVGGAGYAYDVTTSITGTLLKLGDNGKTFQVMDERTRQAYTFTLGERTRFRADKKVMGKKEIDWSELAEGHRVRVTFKVPQNSSAKVDALSLDVREIKVIKPKVT